MALLVNLLK